MWIIGIILLAIVGLFVFENRTPVTLAFVGWRYDTSQGLAMLAAFVAGAIILYFPSAIAQARLRAKLRNAEARLREMEQQLKAAAQQIPKITYGERE